MTLKSLRWCFDYVESYYPRKLEALRRFTRIHSQTTEQVGQVHLCHFRGS